MERWSGRVAVVTGASSGIGAFIVRALSKNGMKVVGVARRVELVQKIVDEMKSDKSNGEVFAIQCDVGVEEDVKKVFIWARDNLGGVDVLVNNAGVATLSLLADLDYSAMKKILDTNIIGLCLFTSEAIKDMKSRGVDDGHIIHINSVAGHAVPNFPGGGVYIASKHAVTALTESLRQELSGAKSKIRVTSVSPGLVRTEIFQASNFPEEIQKQLFAPETPILEGADVARAVVFALSSPPHVQIHEVTVHPTGEGSY